MNATRLASLTTGQAPDLSALARLVSADGSLSRSAGGEPREAAHDAAAEQRSECARALQRLEAQARSLATQARADAAEALVRIVAAIAPELAGDGSRRRIIEVVRVRRSAGDGLIEIRAHPETLELVARGLEDPACRLVADDALGTGAFVATWAGGGLVRDSDAIARDILAALLTNDADRNTGERLS